MAVEWTWAEAGQIGGVGFGLTFLILIILAIAIWIVGLVTRRKGEESDDKKGE